MCIERISQSHNFICTHKSIDKAVEWCANCTAPHSVMVYTVKFTPMDHLSTTFGHLFCPFFDFNNDEYCGQVIYQTHGWLLEGYIFLRSGRIVRAQNGWPKVPETWPNRANNTLVPQLSFLNPYTPHEIIDPFVDQIR